MGYSKTFAIYLDTWAILLEIFPPVPFIQSLITLIPRDRGFSGVYRAVIAFLLIIPWRFN